MNDPFNPTFKYKLKLSGGFETTEIEADKNFAYLANSNKFIVLDISNPDSVTIVYIVSANVLGVFAFNSIAVHKSTILTGYMGILVFNNNNITSVVERDDILPRNFKLFQNYPNPFNLGTLIKYQLSATSHVTLKIYDILGREIKTFVNKVQQTGNYIIPFEASELSSGVYLYRLEAISNDGSRYVSVKKMVLLK